VNPAAAPGTRGPTEGAGPRPLAISGLLLLDPHGHVPAHVDSVVVNDLGIGVTRRRGEAIRVLPWDAVVAHAVEPWAGGVVPEWWVGPEGGHDPDTQMEGRAGTEDGVPAARRGLPHAEPGALISVQTRTGTYRFLRPGADPAELAARIDAFAVRHHGPTGRSTVTTLAPARTRRGYGARSGWARVRPYLVVLAVAVVLTAVTLILLQSSGAIHLPFLGGGATAPPTGPGAAPPA